MSIHSYSKLWIHIIWGTLNREKYISEESAPQISKFLFAYCGEKKIHMRVNFVNPDHVHALIDLPTSESIENVLQLLKGASSHYINREIIRDNKFSWGRGYSAFSVSESQLDKVTRYIKNQAEHHKRKSFSEEYEAFIVKYGMQYLKE